MKLSEKIRGYMTTNDAALSVTLSQWANDAENLEAALRDVLDCLKARADLSGASAYRGMGVNIMQEKAAKLPAAIRYADKVLERNA